MPEHVVEAEKNVLVIPMIELECAGEEYREPCSAFHGVNIFFGPADYSSTAGFAGQWEGPGVAETILAVREKIAAAGKFSGVIAAGNENLVLRKSQGDFQMRLGRVGGWTDR